MLHVFGAVVGLPVVDHGSPVPVSAAMMSADDAMTFYNRASCWASLRRASFPRHHFTTLLVPAAQLRLSVVACEFRPDAAGAGAGVVRLSGWSLPEFHGTGPG